MRFDLTDQRIKALAKNLRSRLPEDPGQRRTLDMLAESLGYQAYGALKNAMRVTDSQPAADTLPDLLRLLDRTPVGDFRMGYWKWRQFRDVEHADEIEHVLGLKVRIVTLDSDPGDSAEAFRTALEHAYDTTAEIPPLTDWQPTPPEGDGWILAGQYENEAPDHCAVFVRVPENRAAQMNAPADPLAWQRLLAEIEDTADRLAEFGDSDGDQSAGANLRMLAQQAREGILPSDAAETRASEVHVVTIKGDDDTFVWAAEDERLARTSADTYLRETMGYGLDTAEPEICEISAAELLRRDHPDGSDETTTGEAPDESAMEAALHAFLSTGERSDLFPSDADDLAGREYIDLTARLEAALSAARVAPTGATRDRPLQVEFVDPHGNLVDGAHGPAARVLPQAVRYLEAMASDGLAAAVRLHGLDRAATNDTGVVFPTPDVGTIDHPWFGYAPMDLTPSRRCFQTRFDMPDWRALHDDAENAGPALKVIAEYIETGVRFTFTDGEGGQRELMLENSQGRPKINSWSDSWGDSDAIVLIETDRTVVTAGISHGPQPDTYAFRDGRVTPTAMPTL